MKTFIAALTFFTRLPIWRIIQVDSVYYKRVVDYWSVIGWLTGGITALTLYAASTVLPYTTAVIIAFIMRLILTGALHEDGLADFFDGFGGGTSRERILTIMKDSHIGTYGVIGLIFYYLTIISAATSLPVEATCLMILAADPWSKFAASQIVNLLPYARNEETAKNHTVYSRMKPTVWFISFAFGFVPLFLLPFELWWGALASLLVAMLLILLLDKKINGYTGDCCGAVFLISELTFYIVTSALFHSL